MEWRDNMINRVEIWICGRQSDLEEEAITVSAKGKCLEKEAMTYVFYDEVEADSKQVTQTMLQINWKEKQVKIKKMGAVQTNFIFQEGKKQTGNYRVEGMNFSIAIDTSKILLEEQDGKINLQMAYVLEMNADVISNCHMQIRIEKEK